MHFIQFNPFQNFDDYRVLPLNYNKFYAMGAAAVACLSAAVWKAFEDKPWAAVVITLAGISLEIALLILMPTRLRLPLAEANVEFLNSTHDIKEIVNYLERCYPVTPVNPTKLQNKQTGGLFGLACGDAIGLFTEFTTRDEAQGMIMGQPLEMGDNYPPGFIHGANWGHISRFIKNGWTDDTDQALSLLRALYRAIILKDAEKTEEGTPLSFQQIFAIELKKWVNGGLKTEEPFIGRSKPYCMGLGALVGAVLSDPFFIANPQLAAEKVWAHNRDKPIQNRPAANGAVMRTAPIALVFHRSLFDVIFYTVEACKVTHVDPRCTASCVAVNIAIALSLRGYKIDSMIKAAEVGALAVLKEELKQAAERKLLSNEEIDNIDTLYEQISEDFKAHLEADWETLDLDEGWNDKEKINKIGYTFKCMGAAFHALRLADQYQKEKKPDIFRHVIEQITGEGGDADTNGAVAGALVGAYLGFEDQFPDNWITHLADQKVIEQAKRHIHRLSYLHSKDLTKS